MLCSAITMENPAERLVRKFGGRAGVANRFSVSTETVRLWLKNGIPTDRALEVQEATDGAIAAHSILRFAQKSRE